MKNIKTWEGKEGGRSIESAIATLFFQMNRYAKNYSKAVMHHSKFSTQEEFIYLINLNVYSKMTKMELINKNLHDKATGIKIINRLIKYNWVKQKTSTSDLRTKMLTMTHTGKQILKNQMPKIRQATNIVTGNLDEVEKQTLFYLLNKLHEFHHSIYCKNYNSNILLVEASKQLINIKTQK